MSGVPAFVDPPSVLQVADQYQVAVLRYAPTAQWACIERFHDKHRSDALGQNGLLRLLLADYYANMGQGGKAAKLIEAVNKQPRHTLSARAQG
jgi:hypothetical protein